MAVHCTLLFLNIVMLYETTRLRKLKQTFQLNIEDKVRDSAEIQFGLVVLGGCEILDSDQVSTFHALKPSFRFWDRLRRWNTQNFAFYRSIRI